MRVNDRTRGRSESFLSHRSQYSIPSNGSLKWDLLILVVVMARNIRTLLGAVPLEDPLPTDSLLRMFGEEQGGAGGAQWPASQLLRFQPSNIVRLVNP